MNAWQVDIFDQAHGAPLPPQQPDLSIPVEGHQRKRRSKGRPALPSDLPIESIVHAMPPYTVRNAVVALVFTETWIDTNAEKFTTPNSLFSADMISSCRCASELIGFVSSLFGTAASVGVSSMHSIPSMMNTGSNPAEAVLGRAGPTGAMG